MSKVKFCIISSDLSGCLQSQDCYDKNDLKVKLEDYEDLEGRLCSDEIMILDKSFNPLNYDDLIDLEVVE